MRLGQHPLNAVAPQHMLLLTIQQRACTYCCRCCCSLSPETKSFSDEWNSSVSAPLRTDYACARLIDTV